jgi:hypothetical protein
MQQLTNYVCYMTLLSKSILIDFYNQLLALESNYDINGFVTGSSGNHGLALDRITGCISFFLDKDNHRHICEVYFLPVAAASSSLTNAESISSFLVAILSSRLFLASLTFDLRASAWSVNILERDFSAFLLWINSMRTRLFLNTLPLALRYSSWYKWRSIFLASL